MFLTKDCKLIKDADFVNICSNRQKEMLRKEVDHLYFR